MTASLERQHLDRLPFIEKHGLRILPISAIYGANASGKTSFIEALEFFRNLVLYGTANPNQIIPLHRFKLDKQSCNEPTKFEIDLLIQGKIYSYKLSLVPNKILFEHLSLINSRKNCCLFSRSDEDIVFNKDYFGKDRLTYLNFVSKATRNNQLFLTNAIKLNSFEFQDFYEWFDQNLVIIRSTNNFRTFQHLSKQADLLNEATSNLLKSLDTGINRLKILQSKQEFSLNENIFQNLDSPKQTEEDDSIFESLHSIHKDIEGNDISFPLADESDGIQRLLALLPAFINLRNQKGCVLVIDQLDCSLHALLQEWLIQFFLSCCSEDSRNQLIFTTHNVNLLNQKIFRRDELYGISKSKSGCSAIYSFRDFKGLTSDKNIREIYLNGLVGAVPIIH